MKVFCHNLPKKQLRKVISADISAEKKITIRIDNGHLRTFKWRSDSFKHLQSEIESFVQN